MQNHLMVGAGRALFVGRFRALPVHRFAANAVLVSLDDGFDLVHGDSRVEQHEATFVRGWQWHGLDFHGGRAAVLFLEPGATLSQHVDASTLRYAVEAALASGRPEPWSDLFHNALHLGPSPLTLSSHVARVASLLASPGDGPYDTSTLARQVGSSMSLIEHRFKEQVGVPIGAYRAWHRMLAATSLAVKGQNLTEVAHAAGFYDSAHFSRLFHRMFGLPPSHVFNHGLVGTVVGNPLR